MCQPLKRLAVVTAIGHVFTPAASGEEEGRASTISDRHLPAPSGRPAIAIPWLLSPRQGKYHGCEARTHYATAVAPHSTPWALRS
jgi:hypothetical protein